MKEKPYFLNPGELDGKSETNLVLGGIMSPHTSSFAQAALRELCESSDVPTVATTQNPKNKADVLRAFYPKLIVPNTGIKVDADAKEKFKQSIAELAENLTAAGVKRLQTVLTTIAGGGAGQMRGFLNLKSGEMDTRLDADGNPVDPEYQNFLAGVIFTTGEIFDVLLTELSARGLIDKESLMAMIGYESRGHDLNDQPNQTPDRLMKQIYAPIAPGKASGQAVADKWKSQGFKAVNINTVEALTNSSRVFPAFEMIVAAKFFRRMWENSDARANPFWQPLFEHIAQYYPKFPKIAERCEEILGGSILLDIWEDENLTHGAKGKKTKAVVNQNFDANTMADLRTIGNLISLHVSKAFGKRWMELKDSLEIATQSEFYIGYRELAKVDLPPESEVGEIVKSKINSPINFKPNSNPESRKSHQIFEEIGDGVFQVVRGHSFEKGHMAIVRGVDQFLRGINGELRSDFEYKADFKEMMQPGTRFRIKIDEMEIDENGKKVNAEIILFDVDDPTCIYATMGYKPRTEPQANLNSMVGQKSDGSGGINVEEIWPRNKAEIEQMDLEAIKNQIPHNGEYLFARELEIAGRRELKGGDKFEFLCRGWVEMGENDGLEDLGDAAAQICCAACQKGNFDTIFRKMRGVSFSEAGIQKEQQKHLAGRYQVQAKITVNQKIGNSTFSLLVLDENESVVLKGRELTCFFA